MGKSSEEPVSSYQAFWISFLSAGASAVLVLVATGNVPWLLKKIWSQEAAGWASAVVTFGAVLVALTISSRERAHAKDLRDDDWKREDKRLRERNSALANVFHGELLDAADDLGVLLRNTTEEMLRKHITEVRKFLIFGDQMERMSMLNRFADSLDGFDPTDQFNILSALALWQPFAKNLPQSFLEASDVEIRDIARGMRIRAENARACFFNLQLSLERYMYDGKAVAIPAPRIRL